MLNAYMLICLKYACLFWYCILFERYGYDVIFLLFRTFGFYSLPFSKTPVPTRDTYFLRNSNEMLRNLGSNAGSVTGFLPTLEYCERNL